MLEDYSFIHGSSLHGSNLSMPAVHSIARDYAQHSIRKLAVVFIAEYALKRNS